jgi:hypothetical protein
MVIVVCDHTQGHTHTHTQHARAHTRWTPVVPIQHMTFKTDIHTPVRIRTWNPGKRAAAIGEIKRRGRNCRVVLHMGITSEYGVFLAESLACL